MLFSLQVGDLVRFYHKEMEAYLVAEGLFDDELTEDGESLEFKVTLPDLLLL